MHASGGHHALVCQITRNLGTEDEAGMRFGHAGTIVEGKADTTADKIERMTQSGISVAERIEEIPKLIQQRLAESQ